MSVFEQRDEAAAKAQKVRGTHHKSLQKMFQIAAGAELGRNFQQLVKFLRLGLGGGTKFSMGHGHRAETGNRRNQRSFLRRESSCLPGINQNCPLRARRAEGRRDQHSGRNQAAQRVLVAADGDGNGLSCGDGALRQIGGEADGLAVMAAAECVSQLRSLGGDGAQFERPLAAQQHGDQASSQKQTQTVRQSLDHGGNIGSSVQGVRNISQDFGAAVLLARSLAEPGGFQQTAQLSGQNSGFGGKVLIKKFFIGIMQKGYRADDFIEDHQRSSHQGRGPQTDARRETWVSHGLD